MGNFGLDNTVPDNFDIEEEPGALEGHISKISISKSSSHDGRSSTVSIA